MAIPLRRGRAPLWLLSAAMLLALVAGLGLRPVLERDYYRYLLVFDITQSMNVRDALPGVSSHTRLDWSKLAARELLSRLPCGSAAGIGIFTQHRSLLLLEPVEVCGHYDELRALLADLDWGMAWRARSEVAKGLHSALAITAELRPPTRLVFFTDGHEAPPLHPDFPPRFDGRPGEVQGLVVGVGGALPLPIPKLDAAGDEVGVWAREEVMQVDVYSQGRDGGLPGETMVGVDAGDLERRKATGTEHLSSLREAHLGRLAAGLGLDYRRLESADALSDALIGSRYALRRASAHDVHAWLGAGALAFILLIYMVYYGSARRTAGPRRASGPHRGGRAGRQT